MLTKQTGTPHAILDFSPSPDGRRIAYAVQAGGGEIGTLHVVDVATGKELITPIDRIRYASVAWLDDGSGFFFARLREGYEKLPPGERFGDRTTHFLSLDAPDAARKVFSASHNAELKLPDYASAFVYQIPGTKLAAAWVFLGVERHRLYYLADLDDAKRGTAKWRQVVSKEDQAAEIWPAGGYLYVRSSKGAPRFRVVRMPLDAPDMAKAQVVVPASESVVTGIRGARDALYVVRRDGATQSLWRLPHVAQPTLERIALPFEGSVDLSDGWSDRDGVVMSLAGWTRATRPYAYDPKGGLTALPFAAAGALDAPSDIVAREVRVKSHDGVEVPLSIISRRDIRLDGSSPAILYGYGAYGTTEDPFFNPRTYAWLSRGGVYAIAHVRGGGAFGEEWHMAGRKATKPNTWKDAIAAAEWLVANGYTSKSKLGILGGSAGGIFVGRAITERPDLFAAAVPAVGVFDGPRFEASANGVANVPEMGTVKDEAEFRGLMAMSTYHAIRDGTPYPGILLVHGVNDIRVDVWQSLKVGARFADRDVERQARADAPRVRQRPRPGQHARAAAAAHRRHLVVHALAVRRPGVPAHGRAVRSQVLRAAAAALAALAVASALRAATFAGVDVPAPLPARPVVDTYWGVSVEDPYRFLEDTAAPDVQRWMRAQADATAAAAVANSGPRRVPRAAAGHRRRGARGGRRHRPRRPRPAVLPEARRRREPVQTLPARYPRRSGSAAGRRRCDREGEPAGRTRSARSRPPPDGRHVAYTLSAAGSEIGTLNVIDAATGKATIAPIDRVRGGGISWLPDGSGFFHSRLAPDYEKRPRGERFMDAAHVFPLTCGAGAPSARCSAPASTGTCRSAATTAPSSSRCAGTISRSRPSSTACSASARCIVRRCRPCWTARHAGKRCSMPDAGVHQTTRAGGWLYLRTAQDAPRFKVLRIAGRASRSVDRPKP